MKKKTISTSINHDENVDKKACLKNEVQAYLIEKNNNNYLSPLEWGRVKGRKYRNVDRFARKWLAVPATSTPSDRLFSICGLVDNAERSNLLGVSIKNQVFCYSNIEKYH